MNYKRIISSRDLRIKILQALSFVPDQQMIRFQYRLKTGRKLNLEKPLRYTEKLQWYKLNYKNQLLRECVDKYDVRKFVSRSGLDNILNECYGVYHSPDEINYGTLPDVFVCKDTLGGGSNSVIICKNGITDMSWLQKQMCAWVKQPINKKNVGREWPYEKKQHRIIIEKFLIQNNKDLVDYKFFCFDGKVRCFYVRTDYANNHDGGKMTFFDDNKKVITGLYMDYCGPSSSVPPLPKEIDQMVEYAEILSKPFPHVRVDLYNVDGKVIFGELTFFNASGYMSFIPDEFDYTMGDYFSLPI